MHTGDGKMNRSPMRSVRGMAPRYKYILNLAAGAEYQTHISEGAGVDGRGYWDSWVELARRDGFSRSSRASPA